ncbi:hypothetical protein C4G28_RS22580 [Vibrio parahaemolyticus]|nr:hypothetical protein [Vibrio parahaemolyticus]EJG0790978.1 hypothetical protein [Vibrio parahaemolyticus]HCE2165164.1 hypothetical protein [Vibrio parahaemolyticus]
MAIQEKSYENTISSARNELTNLLDALKTFEFPERINKLLKLGDIELNSFVSEIPVGSNEEDYIYILKVVGRNRTNRVFYDKLEDEKAKPNNPKDFPRLNKKHKGSQYLYVGRSHKLRSRIRQHLGSGHKGTYALHMMRWANKIEENIELQYFKLEGVENLVVQAVEDALWSELRPAFGRKGDK